MARILDVLTGHGVFRGLPPEALADLLVECRLRTPRKGDALFAAGEPAEAFFLVARGRVKLFSVTPDGREHVVEVFGAGEAFALLPVMERGRYPVHAAALSDAAVVRIPAAAFRRLQEARPEVRERAAREVAERMRRFRARVEEMSTRSVLGRVAAHVLRLAERDGGAAGDGAVVDLGATREVVAASLGTVREVLIRNLRRLERENLVVLRGRRVEIRDADLLRRAAEG